MSLMSTTNGAASSVYLRDLRLLRSWRERVYAKLGLERTHRNRMIILTAISTVAAAYENNRNDEARFEILLDHVADLRAHGAWEHIEN